MTRAMNPTHSLNYISIEPTTGVNKAVSVQETSLLATGFHSGHMAPIKTQHKRHAIGCWTCRRRKIKCDGGRPVCLKCCKSKIQCDGYDVKLSWVSLLGIDSNQQFIELKKESDSEKTARSRIEFCKWWLYDCYYEIDQDLEKIDSGGISRVGPFRVFESNPQVEKAIQQHRRPTISRKSSSSVFSDLKKPFYLNPISPDNSFKITELEIVKEIELIRHFLQNQEMLPNVEFHNDIKSCIGDYLLVPRKEEYKVESQLNLILLLSIIVKELMDLKISKAIVMKIWTYYGKIHDFLRRFNDDIVSMINDESHDSIALNTFEKFMNVLNFKIIINCNLGITEDWLFFNDTKIQIRNNDFRCSLTYRYFKFFQYSFQFINGSMYVMSETYKDYYRDLNNDYNLLKKFAFKPHHQRQQKDHARVSYSTNKKHQLISKARPGDKQFKIKVHSIETPKDQIIIKIPKYHHEESDRDEPNPPTFLIRFGNESSNENNSDENEGSGIGVGREPESIQRDEPKLKAMDVATKKNEGDKNIDPSNSNSTINSKNDTNDGNDDDSDDNSDSDDVDESDAGNNDGDDIGYRSPNDNLFLEFNELSNSETSVYGISLKLIYLYYELCHLINHKRIFNKIEQASRNWMRICCDYEDVLVRQIPKVLRSLKPRRNNQNNNHDEEQRTRDDVFHNFLIFCFFKYVKNYPMQYLSYHLRKFQENDLNIGVLKFVSHNILNEGMLSGSQGRNSSPIYGNNYQAISFLRNDIKKKDLERFNGWDSTDREFFVV